MELDSERHAYTALAARPQTVSRPCSRSTEVGPVSRLSSGLTVVVAVLVFVAACTDDAERPHSDAAAGGTSKLEVSPVTIDLGTVPVGQWANATFLLRNAGDAPLRFTDAPWVKAVAGC